MNRTRKQPNRHPGALRRGFTLLELLVVMGIMIIVVSIALPGFKRIVTGSAVTSSARMLAGQLALARAAAISEQRYIAVIMPGARFKAPSNAESGGVVHDAYHFRSYRIGVVEKGNNAGEFKLVEWYPGSKWTFLPVGAVLAQCNYHAFESGSNHNVLKKDTDGNCTVNPSWLSGDTPELTDWNSPGEPPCYVIDGGTSSNPEKQLVPGQSHTSASASARCVVFSPKGRSCSFDTDGSTYPDRYITIAEGNVTPDGSNKFQWTEPERSSIQVLHVSGMTGGCNYMNIDGVAP